MTKARDLADLLDTSGNLKEKPGRTVGGRDLKNDGDKLDGIEANATADQDHSEIRALIEVGVDTNVFTDADHTKLDGIEANATADQTAAEIRALVESATDSNVFTDADHTKLNGIESGATADQTKADIDALNINADTLDGQHGSYYTGYTDTAVANLVDTAPGTLDTLNELAAALGDDPNFATTTATNIGTKANKTITVSAGSGLTGGGDLTANRTISHADTSTVSSVNGSGNTFIQDIGFDTYGHVTSVGTGTVTVGDGAMTVTAGSGLSGGGQLGTANQSGASSISLSVTDAPKWTTARTLSLSGDASGSTSWDGSGNASISVTVANDSHTHDGRYYTESEANSRFVRTDGGTYSTSFTGNMNSLTGFRLLRVQGATNQAFTHHHNAINLPNASGSSYESQIAVETTSGTTNMKIRSSSAGMFGAWQQVFTDGYHPNADKWTTARTLSLSGDASGSVSWDGSANATLSVTVNNDSHTHDGRYYTEGEADGRFEPLNSTIVHQGGDITSQNWNDYWNGTEASWNTVLNATGSNRPPAYTYGTALSFGKSNQAQFQLYAPESGSNGEGLRYRTSWNNASRPWVEIWDSGNDGAGSGLDADLLDGVQGSSYLRVNGDGSQLTGISGTPAGAVIYHAGSTPPTGFIKANGASLSTSTYAALFAAIGYTYGGSGGSFNVPDLRGEFIRGWDDSRGVDSGRSFGSYQSDDFGSHSHTAYGGFSSSWFSVYARSGSWGSERYMTTNSYQTATTGAADTRPRNRALLACIKI